jgi:hypothetical protein
MTLGVGTMRTCATSASHLAAAGRVDQQILTGGLSAFPACSTPPHRTLLFLKDFLFEYLTTMWLPQIYIAGLKAIAPPP